MDSDDRYNTSAYVFMLGSGAISWLSKKQPIVTLSTPEVEYVPAAISACHAIWLRRLLEEFCCKQEVSTPIYRDNSSTIKLSLNPVFYGRTKHIDVRYRSFEASQKMVQLN